jgi:uncharacterized protein (DUF4415 family)
MRPHVTREECITKKGKRAAGKFWRKNPGFPVAIYVYIRNLMAVRKSPPTKTRITIWVDSDLLLFFKGNGKRGYQTRINRALRETAALKKTA